MSYRSVLGAIGRVLRLETHNLVVWPGLIWQQCYNELQWDEAAREALAPELARREEAARSVPWLHRRTRLRQARGLIQVLEGHEGEVFACAISPQASFVASGGDDHTVRIWDLATGRELRRLVGHERAVLACALAPDGTYLVSGSADATLRIWDPHTGAELQRFEGHEDAIRTCAVASDGSFVVSGSGPPALGEGAFMTSGSGAVTHGEPDFSVRVWDPRTGIELQRFEGHRTAVRACAIAPDGSFVVSAAEERPGAWEWARTAVRLWDPGSGRPLKQLKGHRSSITDCTVSPDGSRVISASRDGTLAIWDAKAGRRRGRIEWPGHKEQRGPQTFVRYPAACAVSPDGSLLAAGGNDASIRLWDPASGEELGALTGHRGEVTACAVSPDGELVVSASRDGSLRIWSLGASSHAGGDGHAGAVTACAVTADGSFFVSASEDKTLKIWESESGAERRTLTGHRHDVDACAVAPDGSFIVSGGKDGTLKMWDAAAGREIRLLTGREAGKPISGCAVPLDGSLIACAMSDTSTTSFYSAEGLAHALRVWSSDNGELLHALDGWGIVRGCAFTPDGMHVVVGVSDGSLLLWQPATGSQRRVAAHSGNVYACAVSPDGAYVLSAGEDEPYSTLKLWDLGSDEVRTLGNHFGALACAVSRDGSLAVSGGRDQTLRVWELSTGSNIATIPVLGAVRCVALHPTRPLALCGDSVGAVNVIELVGVPYGPAAHHDAPPRPVRA